MRFKDDPDPRERGRTGAAGTGDKIMHAGVRVGETTILASDGRCLGRPTFQGFAVSLTVRSDDEAE